MSIDWANLRHVIEMGTAEACADAGLKRVAIRVTIAPLPSGTPAIQVEVAEVPEDVAAAILAEHKTHGN